MLRRVLPKLSLSRVLIFAHIAGCMAAWSAAPRAINMTNGYLDLEYSHGGTEYVGSYTSNTGINGTDQFSRNLIGFDFGGQGSFIGWLDDMFFAPTEDRFLRFGDLLAVEAGLNHTSSSDTSTRFFGAEQEAGIGFNARYGAGWQADIRFLDHYFAGADFLWFFDRNTARQGVAAVQGDSPATEQNMNFSTIYHLKAGIDNIGVDVGFASSGYFSLQGRYYPESKNYPWYYRAGFEYFDRLPAPPPTKIENHSVTIQVGMGMAWD